MTSNSRKAFLHFVVPAMALVAILSIGGCKKKVTAAAPPLAPAATGALPTATLTAAPLVVNAGEQIALTWHTTDATDVSIDGIGAVPTSGTKSVIPTQSTTYHLTARGDGGSTDASVRVTVNGSSGDIAPVNSGDNSMDDVTFHQNVQDIFFDYDSYEVNPDSKSVIAKDAAYLAAHPQIKVVVGGYCDERGSTEYNLALGENRANSAKLALQAAGVAPDRLRTVSYGKEKQFCSDHNETCWQQNRRAQLSPDR